MKMISSGKANRMGAGLVLLIYKQFEPLSIRWQKNRFQAVNTYRVNIRANINVQFEWF